MLSALNRARYVSRVRCEYVKQVRNLSLQVPRLGSSKTPNEEAAPQASEAQTTGGGKSQLGTIESVKMILGFTCEVCSTRNNKMISKQAYTKGVIIVKCEGCTNNHLIADNLGWFTDKKKHWTIEHIMAEKGETVKRLTSESDAWEIVQETLELMSSSEEKK